ncbi:hypothetical protein BFW01_g5253 [Lasiodiplodia theobromae]|nr:hypothetical protein BFW01_g5253 [Lasiodiplodia theobromae]
MLLHAWLTFAAMILPALALALGSVIPNYTTTVEKFISVPGWTTTVTVAGDCTHPASSSTASAPHGLPCLPNGPLYKVVKGTSTMWPCGTPSPNDSITIIPGVSTFTVVPESTTEVFVTATEFVTVPESESTMTSTIWVTKTKEPTTALTSISFSTVASGTSTISHGSPAMSASPHSHTVSGVSLAMSAIPHFPTFSRASKHPPSFTPHTPHGSTHSWNFSMVTTRTQRSGHRGGVTVLHSHTAEALTTRTVNVTTTTSTTWAGVSTVTSTITAVANNTTRLPSIMSTPYGHSSLTASSTFPMPSACREDGHWGNLTFHFDGPHAFDTGASDSLARIQSPNLRFNAGYVYAPASVLDQIEPASPPHLAMYQPNVTAAHLSVENALRKGGIGGIKSSAFNFNAHGGYFSCLKGPISLTNGPDPLNCTLEVSGFRWDRDAKQENLHAISTFHMAPCLETNVNAKGKCEMTEIDFSSEGSDFTGLSSISIKSYFWVDVKKEQVFFMDDLKLSWTDNSCEAGAARGGGV